MGLFAHWVLLKGFWFCFPSSFPGLRLARQVADTLLALEHDAETLHAQSQALDAAEEALRLIEVNYEAGLPNYLQVLIADSQYHQAKIGYLQAVAQRFQDTVALFVALGGGWWNAEGDLPGN